MTVLSDFLSSAVAVRLGWTLFHSTWQFVCIAVLLWATLTAFRRRSANVRYVVAGLALLATFAGSVLTFHLVPDVVASRASLVTVGEPGSAAASNSSVREAIDGSRAALSFVPPLESDYKRVSSLPWGERTEFVGDSGPASPLGEADVIDEATDAATSSTIMHVLAPWVPWVSLIWIGGVVVLSCWHLSGWMGVQRLRRVGTSPVSRELANLVRTLSARMKVSQPVRVLQSTLVEVPIVAGWLRPVILLPVSLVTGLPASQLEAILAHELAHIRRNDYLANLLQTVAETLLFYHPAVWWISRQIRVERELCCDDAAVCACGSKTALAAALTEMEVSRIGVGPVLAATGNHLGFTFRRVQRLLSPKVESHGASRAAAAVLALALLGTVLTAGVVGLATAEDNEQGTRSADTSSETIASSENNSSSADDLREALTDPEPLRSRRAAASEAESPRSAVAGRVTDADGKAVAGALIEWGYYEAPPQGRQRTTTDGDGRYRLETTEYGVGFRLGVSAPGMAPVWRVVCPTWIHTSEPVRDEDAVPPPQMDFQLEPMYSIAGTVVDRNGNPIKGVQVSARTASEGFYSSFSSPSPPMQLPGDGVLYEAVTDAAGKFGLTGLPAKQIHLNVTAAHRHVNAQNYPVDREARIVMSGSGRPGILCARAVDARTGKPVDEFRVVRRYDPKQREITSVEGRFQWDDVVTEGKNYTLYIYSRDHAPTEVDIRAIAVGSSDEMTIKLRPGVPFLAVLADAQSGEPLAGVPVLHALVEDNDSYFEWPDRDNYVDGHHRLTRVQRAVTDDKGRFWLSEVDVPKGTLFVIVPGYERLILEPKDLPAALGSQHRHILLHPEASITGVLTTDGQPRVDMGVSIWRSASESRLEEWFESVQTDSQGRYRFGSLASGTYRVTHDVRPSRAVITFGPVATVTLARGEHKEIEPVGIDEPREFALDRVLDRAGKLLELRSGAEPNVEAREEAAEKTVQPADLKIEARVVGVDGKSPERCSITFWEAIDSESAEKTVENPVASRFSIPHVWHDSGTGKTWQPIHNFGAKDGATKEGLAPGDYRVTASIGHGDPTMLAVSDPIRLDGSREHTVVALAIQEGPSLTIKAVDAQTGKPLEYAAIRLVRPDGLPVVSWSSGAWSVFLRENQHTFEHLAPGDYTLEVFRLAYQYGQNEYAAEQMPTNVRLVANRGQQMTVKLKAVGPSEEEAQRRWPWSVTGTVTDQNGRPLVGVEVRASCGIGSLRPTGATNTDEQGRYTLRFGPGMRVRNDATGKWGAGIQAATIFAFKPDHTEKNLCRQGDLRMGDKLPEKGDHSYGDRDRVVVPNQPRRLDFVMVPAASLEGELVDEQGEPIADRQVSVQGKQMLPSTSVLAQGKTDKQGRFRFEGVPANYGWWFTIDGRGRTQPITFPGSGLYRVTFQAAHYPQYNLNACRVISVRDPHGAEVRDRVVGDDPSARPPVSEDLQQQGRSYLEKMAAACRDWLGPPPNEVRDYEYRFRLGDGVPTTHRIKDASVASGAIRQGISYFGTPHVLATRPEKTVFRQVEVGRETILLRFLVQDSVKFAAGNGVSGSWRGYFNTPLREGLIVLDKTTFRPVRTDIGSVQETFSQYMGLGDGRFVPLAVRIQKGSTDWDWKFRVYEPGLWLLAEARAHDGEGRGELLATVDSVTVNGQPAVPMAQDGAAARPDAPASGMPVAWGEPVQRYEVILEDAQVTVECRGCQQLSGGPVRIDPSRDRRGDGPGAFGCRFRLQGLPVQREVG